MTIVARSSAPGPFSPVGASTGGGEATDSYPAGTLDAQGESLSVTLSGSASDDSYTSQYDGSVSVQAGTSPVSDSYPTGTISSQGANKQVSLSDGASDDSYTSDYTFDLAVTAGSISNHEDFFPSGSIDAAGESKSVTVSLTPTGSGVARADYTLSPAQFTGADLTLECFVNGASQGQKSDSEPSTNSGGSERSDFFTWTGLSISKDDTVKIEYVSGSNSTADPVDVTYDAQDSATLDVTVATFVDKGSGFTQVDSTTHSVTDTDGTENTNSGSNSHSTTDSGIVSGDTFKVEITSISTTGTVSSQSVSVDPGSVDYTKQDSATRTIVVATDSWDGFTWTEQGTNTHDATDTDGATNTTTITDATEAFVDASAEQVRTRIKDHSTSGNPAGGSFSVDPENVTYTA